MRKNGVKYLLMGGQACVLYGAAEFSRDADVLILADPDNLDCLRRALDELQAVCIAVPPFELRYLEMGLAIHFRCHHREAKNVRIDVMSKMRGVDGFQALWERRTTIELGESAIDLLSLPDLVKAKKTQRDKDWPMVVRLLEASYFVNRDRPTEQQVEFWFRELRTAALLVELAGGFPAECRRLTRDRPLLALVTAGDETGTSTALTEEERFERDADRQYWAPLKDELRRLRLERRP
jgi:hypothetical protein